MRERLEQGILAAVDRVSVNGAGAPRVPNTTNLSFEHLDGEALVIALDLKGLAVSTGAACASGATEPSHVLTAMGASHARARGSLRISLGKWNTEAEVDFALGLVRETVARLRELAPKAAG
jgi:cysteine desulfurase